MRIVLGACHLGGSIGLAETGRNDMIGGGGPCSDSRENGGNVLCAAGGPVKDGQQRAGSERDRNGHRLVTMVDQFHPRRGELILDLREILEIARVDRYPAFLNHRQLEAAEAKP